MSNRSIRMQAEPLRSLLFSATSGAYTALGTPLAHPARIIKLVNTTDTDMIISYDGITDQDVVPKGGFFLYDVSANMTRSEGFFTAQNTTVYVKQFGTPPTQGSVYLVSYYGA